MVDNKKIIEALQGCKNHWEWLAKHPRMDKQDYFLQNNIPKIRQYCYMCELMKYGFENEDVCFQCPLKGYAWSYKCHREDDNNYSYYMSWVGASDFKLKKFYARKMVKACEEAIICFQIKSLKKTKTVDIG